MYSTALLVEISTVKYVCRELLENHASTVSDIFNILGGIFGGIFLNKNWHFSDYFHFASIWLRKYFIANLFAKVSVSGARKCHSWYVQPYRALIQLRTTACLKNILILHFKYHNDRVSRKKIGAWMKSTLEPSTEKISTFRGWQWPSPRQKILDTFWPKPSFIKPLVKAQVQFWGMLGRD